MENNQEDKRGRKKIKIKELIAIRQLSTSETMAISFYVFLSLLSGARGIALLQMTDAEIARSEMYMSLHQYADIAIWGGVLIAVSVFLALSVMLPREPKFFLTVLSNAILGFIFILLSAAAYENGTSILNFYNHTIISVAHVVLAGLGAIALCRKTKSS